MKAKNNWGGDWGAVVTPEYPEGAAIKGAKATMWQGHQLSGGVLKLKTQFDAKTELRTNHYLLKLVAERKKKLEVEKLLAKEAKSDASSEDEEEEHVSDNKKKRLKYIKERASEGEWKCPKCENMNWACRETCNSRMCDEKNPNPQSVRAAQSERDRAAALKLKLKKEKDEIAKIVAEGKVPAAKLSRNQKRKLVKKRKLDEQRKLAETGGW
jgi:hypothetical protein